MRVDGGDSRIVAPFQLDPIAHLAAHDLHYGYLSIEMGAGNRLLDAALRRQRKEQGITPDAKLSASFINSRGQFNGRYYYNNFEVVSLARFRKPDHWSLFRAVDRTGAFYVGDQPKSLLGDADFRTMMLVHLTNASKVQCCTYLSTPTYHIDPLTLPLARLQGAPFYKAGRAIQTSGTVERTISPGQTSRAQEQELMRRRPASGRGQ